MKALFLLAFGLTGLSAQAALPRGGNDRSDPPPQSLATELESIRSRILEMEKGMIDAGKVQKEAKGQVRKLELLLQLRRQEGELGRRRLAELEGTVRELEARRETLGANIRAQKKAIWRHLAASERAAREGEEDRRGLSLLQREAVDAPVRKTLARLASRSLREIEVMKVDLADADRIEERIHQEKAQLAFLMRDLDEKEGIIDLSRQLQADILRRRHAERMAQLESYRKLKDAEAQVEKLIREFNARMELQKANDSQREARLGRFVRALKLPLEGGKVVSAFGRAYDARSRLYVFRKGIDIAGGKKEPVRAAMDGKVVYSGILPNYGRIAIIDHGDHFYTLCANLGELNRKAGESVAVGDTIGSTDDAGTPVYFEIRSRNVALNPLQWVSN